MEKLFIYYGLKSSSTIFFHDLLFNVKTVMHFGTRVDKNLISLSIGHPSKEP